MEIKPKERLVHIATRIPPAVREKAKALAREKKVKEGEVYRQIVMSFFAEL